MISFLLSPFEHKRNVRRFKAISMVYHHTANDYARHVSPSGINEAFDNRYRTLKTNEIKFNRLVAENEIQLKRKLVALAAPVQFMLSFITAVIVIVPIVLMVFINKVFKL